MARPKRADGGSRHGKHAENVFRVSLYLSAEEKAIAVLAAELAGVTLTEVLRRGLSSEATRLGILSDGLIADKFRSRVTAYQLVLEEERNVNKEHKR